MHILYHKDRYLTNIKKYIDKKTNGYLINNNNNNYKNKIR